MGQDDCRKMRVPAEIGTQSASSAPEQARDGGAAAGMEPTISLDQCPYDECEDPILRAIWQNAFVTSRLYGHAS
jgi:hypothetical protein